MDMHQKGTKTLCQTSASVHFLGGMVKIVAVTSFLSHPLDLGREFRRKQSGERWPYTGPAQDAAQQPKAHAR
jgi:hypothetical protein